MANGVRLKSRLTAAFDVVLMVFHEAMPVALLVVPAFLFFSVDSIVKGHWQLLPVELTMLGGGGTVLVVWVVGRRWKRRVAVAAIAGYGPPSVGWSAAGDPAAQEFRVQSRVSAFVRMYWWALPLLVVFFFIATALGSIPFGGATLPGLAVGFLATGVLALTTLVRKAHRGFFTTVVRMSPLGVEFWDKLGYSARLRWPDIVGVLRAGTATEPYDVGLIGWGERSIPDRAPVEQWERLAAQPRDPSSGAIEVAIPLGLVDRKWRTGPMGAWIQEYRPDLQPVAFDGQPYSSQDYDLASECSVRGSPSRSAT